MLHSIHLSQRGSGGIPSALIYLDLRGMRKAPAGTTKSQAVRIARETLSQVYLKANLDSPRRIDNPAARSRHPPAPPQTERSATHAPCPGGTPPLQVELPSRDG